MTLSKSILLRAFVLLALLSAISTARGSRPETTTKIDVPGAVVTVASGINGDGAIVGWYCLQPCTPARFHGFMLKDDVRTYIDVPNSSDHPAIGTQPRYISPQGVVIGAYLTLEDGATLANPRFRGFAWFEGTFTYFDAPDWIYDNPSYPHSIIPRAINANGDLVGCIHDKRARLLTTSISSASWRDSHFGIRLRTRTRTRRTLGTSTPKVKLWAKPSPTVAPYRMRFSAAGLSTIRSITGS